eukprot:365192-Chlamydomonas_euryale.AAC.21
MLARPHMHTCVRARARAIRQALLLLFSFNGDTSARPEPQTQTPQLFRTFTYEWTLGGGQAPIAGTNASCPFSEPSNGTSGSPYTVAASPSLGAFLGVVTGLMVGFGVVYTIMLFFPGIEDRELTVPYVVSILTCMHPPVCRVSSPYIPSAYHAIG